MQREYLSCEEAGLLAPGQPTRQTVWRWTRHGVNGTRLRHVRVGQRVYTTQQWLEEFFDAAAEPQTAHPNRMKRQPLGVSHERAVAELEQEIGR